MSVGPAKFCTQCGAALGEGVRFCTKCGKPVGGSAPPPAPGATPTGSTARLRRIRASKKVAGVCAGFAEYFETDVTLMRIIWLAMLLIPPHIGLIGYVVAWAVLPAE